MLGIQVRRAVLGDAHVDRSLKNITEFKGEFQEMITRHAWGDIWTRSGLPRNNGVTRDEIKEVLLQSAIYCGIPAVNATFHLAEECGTSGASNRWSDGCAGGAGP